MIVCTIIPNGGLTEGEQAIRATVNTWIKANYASFADGLADLTSDAAFDEETDVDDLTYYNADKVHLTTAGYGLVAAMVKTAVDNV